MGWRWLTNMEKSDGLADRVSAANAATGITIDLYGGPMPAGDYRVDGYDPTSPHVRHLVSLRVPAGLPRDLSDWWAAFRHLEGK